MCEYTLKMAGISTTGLSAGVPFDKETTGPIVAFELFVVLGTVAAIYLLSKFQRRILVRYLTVAAGVLIFELFTAPMWNNLHMGRWAYIYQDVSWILTLGWATLILSTVVLVDRYCAALSAPRRFGVYLLVLTAVVFLAEMLVVGLGIRTYAPEVRNAVVGIYIAGVPVELFYYVAVFTSLVIGFYKYWALAIDNELLVPVLKGHWLRNLAITVLAVLLFELMIEPMVVNAKFPSWSYIYHDISVLMTGLWVAIIWISVSIIDRVFIGLGVIGRFVGYLVAISIIATPLESWFIQHGYRVYGPSARANFTGLLSPITHVPIEVAAAIPLYLALIIAFVRYWEIVRDNAR